MGRNSRTLALYEIEVLEFDKPKGSHPMRDAVIPNPVGLYFCFKCEWEGKRPLGSQLELRCPQCGNNIVPKGKIKVVDTMPIAPKRTVMGKFYDNEQAKRWGGRFGTVTACHKVDISPYYNNIEHLNLKQEPISLEIEQEDLLLNEEMELELPQRKT